MFDIIAKRSPLGYSDLRYEEGKSKLVTYLNPFAYLQARNMRELYKRFDYISSDGALLVKLYGFLGKPQTVRLSPDLGSYFQQLFEDLAKLHVPVYFVGTKPELISVAVENIAQQIPDLNVVGYHSGYFNAEEKKALYQEIMDKGAKVVIVGMGTPLQDQFLVDLVDAGWKGHGYTCGGFLHQTATNIDYYPEWINKYNLRWLYRIYDEPKLFSRYAFEYPKGISALLSDYKKYKKEL